MKEKERADAKRIFNKMLRYDNGFGGLAVSKAWAKYASLNCVSEIIKEIKLIQDNISPHDIGGMLAYWNIVKNEIESM